MTIETLSVEQVCEKLGCGRSRVFELLADGTLERAPRFGRSLRIFGWSVNRALMPREETRKKARRHADPPTPFTTAAFADLLRENRPWMVEKAKRRRRQPDSKRFSDAEVGGEKP